MEGHFAAVSTGGAVLYGGYLCDWDALARAIMLLDSQSTQVYHVDKVLAQRSQVAPVFYLASGCSEAQLKELILTYERNHIVYLMMLPDRFDFLNFRYFALQIPESGPVPVEEHAPH